jgi:diaminopropionate ammonia-lyase
MMDCRFSENGVILPVSSLIDAPALARRADVARVLLKLESERPFGNFKILGGMYAGLRVLADRAGIAIAQLVEQRASNSDLPRLICASDGNHGLAVAEAARTAGGSATIYLHRGVDAHRAGRIEGRGAAIAWIDGTYDDAVDAAAAAAGRGEGILIPDTSADSSDPAVRLVMQGYATLSKELLRQLRSLEVRVSHGFVQAGVGGLAAAIAQGVLGDERHRAATIVVEPEGAACVGMALASGDLPRVSGDLKTVAEMLSCGEASAPAMEILRAHHARARAVDDAALAGAVELLGHDAGVETSASGGAGLAGLLQVANDPDLRRVHGLDRDSVVLLIITEASVS